MATARPTLPPGVGPHEGRELDLMLGGAKPLAMFCDVGPSGSEGWAYPEAFFAPHVATGRLVMREVCETLSDGPGSVRHLYYALPTEAWRIDAAQALSEAKFSPGDPMAHEACARLGRLLGYRETEIRAFLNWVGQ